MEHNRTKKEGGFFCAHLRSASRPESWVRWCVLVCSLWVLMFVLLCSSANALLGPAPVGPKAGEQTERGTLCLETPRLVAQLGEPDSAAPAARSESAFVAVPDLADRLKKLDPNAVIEWDGRRLRIQVQRQRFTLFLVTSDMVVNGTPERVSSPLRVYRGEIYVPQDAVDRIADVLASAPVPQTGETTPTVVATPTPTPVATPTPTPTPTPSPTPMLTPSPTATVQPTAEPSAAPARATVPTEVLRSPTPRGTTQIEVLPTPRGARRPATPAPTVTEARPDVFARALRERVEASALRIKRFREAELTQLAGTLQIRRVVIDPDDGDEAEPSGDARRASMLTLELAQRLKARLQAAGLEVILTREDLRRVPPPKKVELVTNSGAQLLVSLRVGNSATAETQGVCVMYPSDTVDYAVGRPIEKGPDDTMPPDQVYRAFQERSRTLASLCLTAFRGVVPPEHASMLAAPLYLHRRTPMPAVLIVAGYLSNPSDRARLLDPRRQEEFVDMLATPILEFGKGAAAPAGAQPQPTRRVSERTDGQ